MNEFLRALIMNLVTALAPESSQPMYSFFFKRRIVRSLQHAHTGKSPCDLALSSYSSPHPSSAVAFGKKIREQIVNKLESPSLTVKDNTIIISSKTYSNNLLTQYHEGGCPSPGARLPSSLHNVPLHCV